MFIKPAILTLALGVPTIAQAEFYLFPIIYEVVGVASDDVLNVREEPNASAFDLGDLLPGQQTEVTAFDESGKWARVLWQGRDRAIANRNLDDVAQHVSL